MGQGWAKEEELVVKRNYQKGIPWLSEELGRTKHSVNQKVSRIGLNLHRPFLSDEDNFTIENIGSLVATVINSTYGNYFTYKVKGRRALEILNYLTNLNTPYLDRKWLKVKEVLNDQKI